VHSYGSFPTDVSFAALTRLPVGALLSRTYVRDIITRNLKPIRRSAEQSEATV